MSAQSSSAVVRVRVLRPEDVKRVQTIFADGMMSLSPGVVRAGMLGRGCWTAWVGAVAVGALAAWWSPDDNTPRAALMAALVFLLVYASYLSTIMNAYVRQSLNDDMKDPVATYVQGKGEQGNESCFWVAELVEMRTPLSPSASVGSRGSGGGGGGGAALTRQEQLRLDQHERIRQQLEMVRNSASKRPASSFRRRLLGALLPLSPVEGDDGGPDASTKKLQQPAASSSPSEPASKIVGCVALQHRPGERTGELRRMSVDEAARGRGVAAALAAALERHARDRGLESVFCITSSLQAPARALYGGKLGWQEVDLDERHLRAQANGVTFHRYEKKLSRR